jgi:anti-anti-sigma factor
MEISVSIEQGITIMQINGQLDGQTYEELISKARNLIDGGTKNILLDLADLTYISSAGLVSLHSIALMASGQEVQVEKGWSSIKSMERVPGGSQKNIKLLNPRPEVTSVLDMVGFSAFFEVYTDKQKAIESFS